MHIFPRLSNFVENLVKADSVSHDFPCDKPGSLTNELCHTCIYFDRTLGDFAPFHILKSEWYFCAFLTLNIYNYCVRTVSCGVLAIIRDWNKIYTFVDSPQSG